MSEKKYVLSWSGGKDSTASIILAHENNEPLDLIVFVEVMFDEGTSGELPEHIKFINDCVLLFGDWGYKVEILRANSTYIDNFYHRVIKSQNAERNGKRRGFPMAGKCTINRDCKVGVLNKFWKSQNLNEVVQYVGIAIDEPKRMKRLSRNKVSLLAKYGYTEEMAYNLCRKYGLLSPIYNFTTRGGGVGFVLMQNMQN